MDSVDVELRVSGKERSIWIREGKLPQGTEVRAGFERSGVRLLPERRAARPWRGEVVLAFGGK